MKFRMIGLCLGIVLLLAGCGFVSNEYVSVTPHTESYSQPEGEEAVTVSNYTELKNAILSFVEDGVEEAVLTADAYIGDIDEDYEIAYKYITETNPTGAYLVEEITPEIIRAGSYFKLSLTIRYRNAPMELAGARTVRGPSGVEEELKAALKDCGESLLLRVSDYETMDFEEMAARCFEEDLTTVMAKPQVDAEIYPNQGNLRIVELRFTYPRAVAELKVMQSAVNTIMNSAYGYVSYGQSETEKAMLLYSFLSERHAYIEDTSETPAYALLCEGVADSRAFAAVYSAMCTQAGLRCTVVHGMKNGEPYDWNILELDAGIWHVDSLADEKNGLRELQFLTDAFMYGYEWDKEAYPVCAGAPEPPAPVEEEQTPPPEETPPVVPEEPIDPSQPPAEENDPPAEPQPPEENSQDTNISS
ncbi:MAG: transglutaminase domain-containing protein [Ruminococcaceae bacterium]|nr:transglutaminase domain-containing protein [Oscillospiraceae bacterium]